MLVGMVAGAINAIFGGGRGNSHDCDFCFNRIAPNYPASVLESFWLAKLMMEAVMLAIPV